MAQPPLEKMARMINISTLVMLSVEQGGAEREGPFHPSSSLLYKV